MYRSASFKNSVGYYLAVVFHDEKAGYVVVADNPINTEDKNNAAYVVVEDRIAHSRKTGKPFMWEQVISEDRKTARALGATRRKHTTNYQRNVVDTLPKDLRAKISSQL